MPAGTGGGTYTVEAVYNGSTDFGTTTSYADNFTVNPAPTTTLANSATTGFTVGAQTVTLTAHITSTAGTVNEGSETFTVLSGTTVIGSAVTVAVVNGVANAPYVLPAGTPAATYTIQDVYNDSNNSSQISIGNSNGNGIHFDSSIDYGNNYASDTDSTQFLTINPADAATVSQDVTATFSPEVQTVVLNASVTSTAGTVNEGTETFTVMNGTTPVGAPVSIAVGNGVASASYALPAAVPTGTYMIQAVFGQANDFVSDTDSSHNLTIDQAGTTTTAANTSVPYSATAQTVALTSAVTSAAGAIDGGNETFTILNGSTLVGSPVTVNPGATASYTLPAGTAPVPT